MKNIFILYIPPSNYEAVVHYEETIVNKVPQERIFKYVDNNLKNFLGKIFFDKKIAVWGSRNSETNRAKYEKMKPGDEILIAEGNRIKLLGKIAAKTINPKLSQELWKNLKGNTTEGWDLIYFIANAQEINIPFLELNNLFGYAKDYLPRGFTSINEDKVKKFYSHYDDFYSVLLRIKNNEPVLEIDKVKIKEDLKEGFNEDLLEGDNFVQPSEEISKHILMQWYLIELGLKAKTNVWIPKNDQTKIKKTYHFDNFEEEFKTGLDVPIKYINNIDCIWKEEFQIHAAFEVENTTEIYSGLLRFADLTIAAPNTKYPMYIVAPLSKKNKLIEQLKRPTFKKLELYKNVKYLSYEGLKNVSQFFEQSSKGMNLEVLDSKAEEIKL
jgi:hypothetical protein